MKLTATRIALTLCAGSVIMACAAKESDPAAGDTGAAAAKAPPSAGTPDASVVTITARDFSFSGPAVIPAGLTTMRLVNEGPDIHHAQLIRLEGGKKGADFVAALQGGGPFPQWARVAGGPNVPAPGQEANATMTLEAGEYALICLVDSPDRKPHIFKGMVHDFTVAPSTGPVAAEPVASHTIRFNDFAFEAPASVSAGAHVFRVENAGMHDHEVELFRLAPGKTVKDLEAWVHTFAGPPPAQPIGGVAAIGSKQHAFFSAKLDAGDYVLFCFVIDPGSRKMHFDMGMKHAFKVS